MATRATVASLQSAIEGGFAIRDAEISALKAEVAKLAAKLAAPAPAPAPAASVSEPSVNVVDVSAPTPFYKTKKEAIDAGVAACRLYGRRGCKVTEVRPGEWGFATYG